jgi:hypothetical protein
MLKNQSYKSIPLFFWLVMPILFVLMHLCVQFFLPAQVVDALLYESGPYEWAQFIIISAAFFVGLGLLRHLSFKKHNALFVWILLGTLGSCYISGEEISWGQHVFGWGTPENWGEINDHNETNIHNTTKWLDQKPKTLLEIGIYVGAILLPLALWKRPQWVPQKYAIIYPHHCLWVTAAALLFFRVEKELDKLFGVIGFQRVSEVQELLIYYFILLYLIDMRHRILKGS